MCRGKPCFTRVFGQPLRLVVLYLGLVELLITLVVTTLNVIKYTQYVELFGEECASKAVCVGPLIKVKCPPSHQVCQSVAVSLLSSRSSMPPPEFSALSC